MRATGRHEYAITLLDFRGIVSDRHRTLAFENEIDLFWCVAVNTLLASGLNIHQGCREMTRSTGPRRSEEVGGDAFLATVTGSRVLAENLHNVTFG